jgi:hypothetical protein
MKKAEKDQDPPLSSAEERYTYGPDGSRILVIERQRRGFIKDEVLRFEPKAKEPVKPNSRLALATSQRPIPPNTLEAVTLTWSCSQA